MAIERVNIREILQSHSRDLFHKFQEGNRTANLSYDRGLPREAAIRTFLEAALPGRYGVGEGLVIDTEGGQSEQCDAVIYDREMTPRLSTEAAMSVWPYESVYGIVQVKSTLTKAELQKAVANIGAFKRLSRRANNLAGGRGSYRLIGDRPLNAPMGMLIAHTLNEALPTGAAIQEIIESVPREQQIDLYCILTGRVGCRASITDEGHVDPDGLHVDVRLSLGLDGSKFIETDYGEGALAAFLLLAISMMNGILLGDQYFYPYMKFLEQKTPDVRS